VYLPRDDNESLRLGLCLLTVAVVAKVLVLARQATAADAWVTAWAVPAFLAPDVTFAAAFAIAAALMPRRGRMALVIYAACALWLAVNVPVTAVMASPITAGFLHAAGGALGDSFARYLTPTGVVANLGPPAALVALAIALPRLAWRWNGALGLALGGLAALGPAAQVRVDTRGLHRNAVVAVLATSWQRARAGRGEEAAPCPSVGGVAGMDLRGLAGAARDRNVLWVILESTGARALSLYAASPHPGPLPGGPGRGGQTVMPNLDGLGGEGLVFERAYAAYPESIKGLFSMLCGRTPPADAEASDFAGDPRVACPSIAARLAAAGRRTALFHSGRFAYLGMDEVVRGRGFDTLADADTIPSRFGSSFGVDDRATVAALLRWIDESERPFFAVYMPIAGHHPYHAPGEGPRPFAERCERDEYLNDLHTGDEAFGRLREGLRQRGLDPRTLYVVAGDHGEAFREHPGNVAHALFLYEENVRVPLLVAAPGLLRGQRVPQLASLIDLAPTTLDLLGLPPAPGHEGRSALAPEPRVARFRTDQAMRRSGLVDGTWKLLRDETGRVQLYDLARDPDERRDLAGADPGRVARYAGCL
jgi:hypothetical protein